MEVVEELVQDDGLAAQEPSVRIEMVQSGIVITPEYDMTAFIRHVLEAIL